MKYKMQNKYKAILIKKKPKNVFIGYGQKDGKLNVIQVTASNFYM